MTGRRIKDFAFVAYYTGLLLLIASLPLSKFVMSISQFMIVGGWLLDGDIAGKFKRFSRNKTALLVSSVFLLHLAGLAYTTDFAYAFKDIRIKLPLLLLPLILSTGPSVTKKQFEYLLIAGAGGLFVSTVISVFIYAGVIDRPVNNIRDISIFISHIRLALLCCLFVFACSWLSVNYFREGKKITAVILAIAVGWFLFFLVLLESLTGLAIMLVALMLLPLWLLHSFNHPRMRIVATVIAVIVPVAAIFYIAGINNSFHPKGEGDILPEAITQNGNPYYHENANKDLENGYRVWTNISEKELESEWNKRSTIPYLGKDARNQEVRYTLIRFLTSKGLKKDSVAVWSLSEKEIASIEAGIANVDYQEKSNIRARIHQVLWEIHNNRAGGNPSGHSVAQRIEYWTTAWSIISDHPLTGVGTGDVPDAFKKEYEFSSSPLTEQWRLRSHNQYLSIAVAFGIPGLIWFLITLVWPFLGGIKRRDFLYVSFVMIAVISMLTEDTLETQAGVTFFALFNSLLLFVNPQNETGSVISASRGSGPL